MLGVCLPAEPLGLRKYFVRVILKRDSLTFRFNTPHEFAAVGVETRKIFFAAPSAPTEIPGTRYDSYFRSDKIISTWKWRTQPYVASVVSQKFAYELQCRPCMEGGSLLPLSRRIAQAGRSVSAPAPGLASFKARQAAAVI